MGISLQCKKKFISALVFSLVSSSIVIASSSHNVTHIKRYLDPKIWNTVVDENQCFSAAPKNIIIVEPITQNAVRQYKIAQVFDTDLQKIAYAKPIETQVKERRILAKKFCNGIASLSNMELPFAKEADGVKDANDGILLTEVASKRLEVILANVFEMLDLAVQGSLGIHSPLELEEFNNRFKAALNRIDNNVSNSSFNGIKLFNGSVRSIDIRGENGDYFSLKLPVLLTDREWLGISELKVSSATHSQEALSALSSAFHYLTLAVDQLKTDKLSLKEMAKNNAIITLVDVKTDEFRVQHKKPAQPINQ